MRRLLTLAVALAFFASPSFAQGERTEIRGISPSIADAARLEVAKLGDAAAAQAAQDYRPGGMAPAHFWTAIGLMSAGGLTLVGAAVTNEAYDVCDQFDIDCGGGVSKAMAAVGAGLIGAGGVVWFIGRSKARASSPQIVAMPRGVALRGRVGF